jgi:hypothetical protein
MKKLITPILFLFCVSATVAQTATTDDYYNSSNGSSKLKLLSPDRVSASMSAGAGVSFLNSSKSTAYTTFIAPKIGYQLTPKFKLNIGLMHYTMTGNTFMMMNRNEALYNPNNAAVSGNLLFVEGQYQLSKRLIMSGAVMYDANGFNANKQDNYKAASLGLDYKVSEHSSIGFRATISQGNGNYYSNPVNPYAPSSFGHFGNDAMFSDSLRK